MSNSFRSLRRRTALGLAGAFAASAAVRPGRADDKVLRIPINMPFTGQEAEGTVLVKNGAVLASTPRAARPASASNRC